MYNDDIKFYNRDSDLNRMPEYWQKDNYQHRIETVLASVKEKTGFLPSKNMQPIREGVFKVKDETTIEQVVAMSDKLREFYKIDCFQAFIDRRTNTAHLLFDFNDRENGKSVYLNRTDYTWLSVLILRFLDLPRPEGTELWHRYFLTRDFDDDPQVFMSVLDRLKHAKLSKRNYRIARDALLYIDQKCQGLVK